MNMQDKENKIRATVEALGWLPWLVDYENNLVIARRDNAPFKDRKYSTHRILAAELGTSDGDALNEVFVPISGHYDLTLSEALDSYIERRGK